MTVEPGLVTVQGPRGVLHQMVNLGISVEVAEGQVVVSRESDAREQRALHGLSRTLIANMVHGVAQEFQKSLELQGVGYRAQESGKGLILQVGYSHPVEVQPLEGVTLAVEAGTRIHVRGADKQRVGEMAARIRAIRPPDSYKGKGIRYQGEYVKLKPGKSTGRTR